MFHVRPDYEEIWKNSTDDGFALELSKESLKRRQSGKEKERQRTNLRIPFMVQTLPKTRGPGLHTR